jgi:hypothetical protein
MLSQLKGVGWAALLSVGLHGALAWAVLRAPIGRLGASAAAVEPVTIDILDPIEPERPEPPEPEPTVEPPPPEPEPPVEPEPLPEEEVAAIRPTPVEPPAPAEPSAEETEATDATGEEAGSGEPESVSTIDVPSVESQEPTPPEETPEERRRRLSALLDPRNAARGSFQITGPGPSRAGPPAGRGDGRDNGPTEEEIERGLQRGLRAEAMTKNHTTRERVVPRRQSDGSYAWSGHAFSATINPDGSVEFEDRPGVQTDGFSASGSWDLTDAIMGAQGQDPYAAERERFMRETRELRERLEAQHRRQTMQAGLRRLRGRLRRVWSTTSRSHEARRQRIFRIWDDIAEDDTGTEARAIVITFIRDTIPEGSEHAYTEAEIERFNSARQSRERFEPY